MQQINVLDEILKGKSDLIRSTFSANFVLQSVDGKQYNRSEFIEKYISHPKMKIESLTAEDFRIVSATENTVVMTFLEVVKIEGKDAETLAVTEVFSKEKNTWKLVFKKGVN
jgi:hypothetical protein